MINFAVGPVQMEEEIRRIGAKEIPYFRTPEFSALMKENETLLTQLMRAGEGSRAVFLTASGTAAMEAAVINLFTEEDKVLVVNGGSFGARFAKICRVHEIPHQEILLESGKKLTEEALQPFENRGYTGFLVNVGETSTGVLYDMELISGFCRRNNLYLVVDVISSFLADEFYMEKWGVALAFTGSQKALALPPGLAALVLDRRAAARVEEMKVKSLYLDLKEYLRDGERGQTPFTPAVGILLQMNKRFRRIAAAGGMEAGGERAENRGEQGQYIERGLFAEQEKCRALAVDFRERIKDLPFEIVSESLSNAVTPLHPTGMKKDGSPISAHEIFDILKDEYEIFVCPNGGDLKDKIFRVGHIGNLTAEDNKSLADALFDLQNRGLL